MRTAEIITVLSIAGLDPSAGAGLLADARVFSHYGLYGCGALTAVTAQNTSGVCQVYPLDAEQVYAQLESLSEDIRPVVTKIGMLATAAIAIEVAGFAGDAHLGQVVIDPVLTSTSGAALADKGLRDIIIDRLIPDCSLITPNLDEAKALTGIDIGDMETAGQAARAIADMGAAAVCVTGGHWQGRPTDLLLADGELLQIEGERGGGNNPFHGTGCFFSASVAACLAQGSGLVDSVRQSKALTARAIGSSVRPGRGMNVPWLSKALEP